MTLLKENPGHVLLLVPEEMFEIDDEEEAKEPKAAKAKAAKAVKAAKKPAKKVAAAKRK